MRTRCSLNSGPTLPGTETCAPAERTTSRPLTLSVVDSPARTLATPGGAPDLPANDQPSGQSLPESLASLDPDGCWRRTCQGYSQAMMDGFLEMYSGTWPRAGTMRNGTVYRQPSLGRGTCAPGCSLLPTPRAAKFMAWELSNLPRFAKSCWGRGNLALPIALQALQDGENLTGLFLGAVWVEWLMGFPRNWTDCDALATP